MMPRPNYYWHSRYLLIFVSSYRRTPLKYFYSISSSHVIHFIWSRHSATEQAFFGVALPLCPWTEQAQKLLSHWFYRNKCIRKWTVILAVEFKYLCSALTTVATHPASPRMCPLLNSASPHRAASVVLLLSHYDVPVGYSTPPRLSWG